MLLSKVEDRDEWLFWCPGCGSCHYINSRWRLSGESSLPTVSPSILVRGHDNDTAKDTRCHLFIRNGQIRYLGDCTHALAGQTVPMVDLVDV